MSRRNIIIYFNQNENNSTNMCLAKVACKNFPNSCFNVSQNIIVIFFSLQYLNYLKVAGCSTSHPADLPKKIKHDIFGHKESKEKSKYLRLKS